MNPGNAVTFVNRVDVEPIVKKFPLQEAFVMNNLTHIWVSVFVNVSGGTFSACRARIQYTSMGEKDSGFLCFYIIEYCRLLSCGEGG